MFGYLCNVGGIAKHFRLCSNSFIVCKFGVRLFSFLFCLIAIPVSCLFGLVIGLLLNNGFPGPFLFLYGLLFALGEGLRLFMVILHVLLLSFFFFLAHTILSILSALPLLIGILISG